MYRLKHVPTGLYFVPVRFKVIKDSRGYSHSVKSNFSEKGKIYNQKPCFEWLKHGLYSHFHVKWNWSHTYNYEIPERNNLIPYNVDEWVIEEINKEG